jgi:hypothetical protein
VARVAALIPDLLFGSQVVGALQSAGHHVALVPTLDGVTDADVLVVDLTADAAARIAHVTSVRETLAEVPTLAFYAHVETDVRELAEQAGFTLVVPRSRMAREGAALVTRLSE